MKLLVLLLSSLFIFPPLVSAHSGGGPPFLTVDGKFAQTNPYANTTSTLVIPQDLPPASYLSNKPIKLAVDMDEFRKQTAIPKDAMESLMFRWSLWDGDNFDKQIGTYVTGVDQTYTLKTPQSYLVKLEAKSSLDEEYILLDTVQLNVLPAKAYVLPKAGVFIGVQNSDTTKPVLFVSQPKVDPTSNASTALWDIGQGKIQTDSSVKHTFTPLTPYDTRTVYHRIVDSNGFISDIGFVGEIAKGKIVFTPVGKTKNAAIVQGSYADAEKLAGDGSKSGVWGIGLWFVGQLIILSFMAILLTKLFKNKKKTK